MNTEQQIEFDRIKEVWSALALTEDAKTKIAEKTVILEETKLRHELKETTDARQMIEKLGTPPLQDVTEIKEILQVTKRGDCRVFGEVKNI